MFFLAIILLITCMSLAFVYWQVQKTSALETPAEVLAYRYEERKYFQDIHSPTVSELAAVLRENDFDAIAEAVEQAHEPCFRLVADLEADGTRSRLGGMPDLPDSARWPHCDGVPLAFLAQIDLAELAALNPDSPLPKEGLLLFFYDAEQRAWGFDPKDRERWRVLYFNEPFAPVAMDAAPDGLPSEGVYEETPMLIENGESFSDELIGPYTEGFSARDLAVIEDIADQYHQCYEGAMHQVLGFPYTIQGDMRLECQLVSNGIYCGDETGYKDPRAQELEAGATEWRLLFQLDSDDRANMMWGDGGTLYFWIRERDLTAARFDQVWMVLQCA